MAEGNHDLVRATVRAWVHGHLETYTEDVELDSLQRTVATLAQAVYRRYMGTYYRTGGVGSCPSAKSSNFAPHTLGRTGRAGVRPTGKTSAADNDRGRDRDRRRRRRRQDEDEDGRE